MKLEDVRILITTLCFFLLLIIYSYLLKGGGSIREEQFFTISTLSNNSDTNFYFPNNDINVNVKQSVEWKLYIENFFNKVSYISIRFKLLNSTMRVPDSLICMPSESPILYEVRRVIMNDERIEIPLQWSLEKVNIVENLTSINEVFFNGVLIDTDVWAIDDNGFRLIIELWIYNEEFDDFIFGWFSQKEQMCAWNQMWFNANVDL